MYDRKLRGQCEAMTTISIFDRQNVPMSNYFKTLINSVIKALDMKFRHKGRNFMSNALVSRFSALNGSSKRKGIQIFTFVQICAFTLTNNGVFIW